MAQNILFPKPASQLIAEASKDVEICTKGIEKIANVMYEAVKNETFSIKNWKKHELNPKTMDAAAIDWIFLVDTLNFSFWHADEENKFVVNYNGKGWTGYWSLCAAINRAIDNGIPVTSADYYASISQEQLMDIFKSDSAQNIPMLEERLEVLHETGKILLQRCGGSFVHCIRMCDNSAEKLLHFVTTNFPSYQDEAEFGNKQVAFYKRAQILIADIWACFEGQGLGFFYDIDFLTIFADYRIPQALNYFEVLKYSDSLMKILEKDKLLVSKDRLEVEIRGCTIWAIELIKEETKKLLEKDPETKDALFNSVLIDYFLWDYRRDHADSMKQVPFHKVRSIYY